LAAKTLVETFSMVVIHEFSDNVAQVSFTEEDEVFQTLVFYRLHKSFYQLV
jgi:hypothetical protein